MSVALKNNFEKADEQLPVKHLQAPVSSQFVDQAVNIIKDEIQELCTQIGLLLDSSEDDVDENALIDEKLAKKIVLRLKELGAAMRFARFSVLSRLVLAMSEALENKISTDKRINAIQRSALFTNCQLLSRYVDISVDVTGPELGLFIAPGFHRLATAQLIKHGIEAEFYTSAFSLDGRFEGNEIALSLDSDQIASLKRSRQMFQIGLIGLLKGEFSESSFNLIARVCEHNRQLDSEPYSVLWSQIGLLTEALKNGNLVCNAQRCYFYTHCDRLLRSAIRNDANGLDQDSIKSIAIEVELLLSLVPGGIAEHDKRLGKFATDLAIDDKELLEQRQKVETGLSDALQAVAVACRERITFVKNKMATLEASAAIEAEDKSSVLASLEQVKSAAQFSHLHFLLDKITSAITQFTSWADSADETLFENFAADLLAAENSADWLASNRPQIDISGSESAGNSGADPHLVQAQNQLYSEIQANISVAVRGLAAYSESGKDPQHISNLDKSLHSAGSGFAMLDKDRLAELLELCATEIEQRASAKQPNDESSSETDKTLSLIADCLVTADALLHEAMMGRAENSLHQQLVTENIDLLKTAVGA